MNNNDAKNEFLPVNSELEETMSSSMEEVESNPRKYIIEECIPACKELWQKNIYTFMVSDHLNEGECWIEIIFNNLSEDNKQVFASLTGNDVLKFSYHEGCVNFGINAVGHKGQRRLLELAENFQMQDVPFGEAYVTVEDFLISCGCCSEVDNPDYYVMTPPWEAELSAEDLYEYLTNYDEWVNSTYSKKTFTVFDKTKVTKSLDEYLSEYGAIYEDNRVYLSDYHYQKHLNYLNYLNKKSSSR